MTADRAPPTGAGPTRWCGRPAGAPNVPGASAPPGAAARPTRALRLSSAQVLACLGVERNPGSKHPFSRGDYDSSTPRYTVQTIPGVTPGTRRWRCGTAPRWGGRDGERARSPSGGRAMEAGRAGMPRVPRFTVEDQLEVVGFGRLQMLALAAFALIITGDGMELVVTNIIWQQLPAQRWGLEDSGARGMLVSLAFAGFVLGTLVSAALGDTVGRRPLIFIHSGIFIPMSLFSAAADSLAQLAFTRFCVGASMGLVFPSVVSMMAEYTPQRWRARCVVSLPGIAYRSAPVFVRLRRAVHARCVLQPAPRETRGTAS